MANGAAATADDGRGTATEGAGTAEGEACRAADDGDGAVGAADDGDGVVGAVGVADGDANRDGDVTDNGDTTGDCGKDPGGRGGDGFCHTPAGSGAASCDGDNRASRRKRCTNIGRSPPLGRTAPLDRRSSTAYAGRDDAGDSDGVNAVASGLAADAEAVVAAASLDQDCPADTRVRAVAVSTETTPSDILDLGVRSAKATCDTEHEVEVGFIEPFPGDRLARAATREQTKLGRAVHCLGPQGWPFIQGPLVNVPAGLDLQTFSWSPETPSKVKRDDAVQCRRTALDARHVLARSVGRASGTAVLESAPTSNPSGRR